MAVHREIKITDGNGLTMFAARVGEKGESVMLTTHEKGKRKARVVGTFNLKELRQFVRVA